MPVLRHEASYHRVPDLGGSIPGYDILSQGGIGNSVMTAGTGAIRNKNRSYRGSIADLGVAGCGYKLIFLFTAGKDQYQNKVSDCFHGSKLRQLQNYDLNQMLTNNCITAGILYW